jgi:alpha-acetolactate decarboxylase
MLLRINQKLEKEKKKVNKLNEDQMYQYKLFMEWRIRFEEEHKRLSKQTETFKYENNLLLNRNKFLEGEKEKMSRSADDVVIDYMKL